MAVATTAGLVLGSFAAAVSWRVPRGQRWVSTRSCCPACGRKLTGIDLVPVLSWLGLRGRCRTCGTPISPRYPMIELAGALLFCAAIPFIPAGPGLLTIWGLASLLLILSAIDVEQGAMPDAGIAMVALAGAGAAWMGLTVTPIETVAAAAVAGGGVYCLRLLMMRGLGGSGLRLDDVKLAAAAGMWLSPWTAPWLVGAALAGWLLAGSVLKRPASALPAGPAIALTLYGLVLYLYAQG